MTPATLETPSRPVPGDTARRPVSPARLATIAMMIGSLLVTGVLQNVVATRNHELIRNTASTATLSNLNSFSLALLLGGLRGPLVMLLWTTSETQKHDKDLEDFDTKIELIRLLQPEFDSVHIFQIWNKAYNISVQMANLPNKYAAILDAVDYAHKIDQQHANDINTYTSFGQLYFDKLGNSAEKFYYERRVRTETQWREPDRIRPGDPGWRRTKLDPMLDAKGNILPALLAETTPRPADLPRGADWNTGAELQYLKKYEPWPYGLPPMAIGYNYYKRAQVVQEVSHQRHLQLGEIVMDNRPPIALKLWGEMESNDALWAESQALGRQPAVRPIERVEMTLLAAQVPIDAKPVNPAALAEAIYHYDVIVRISDDTLAEYRRHLAKYLANLNNFQSHIDAIQALKYQSQGDRDYLRLMTTPPADRAALREQTAAEYNAAVKHYAAIILRFYLPDDVAQHVMGPRIDRNRIADLPEEQIDAMLTEAHRILSANRGFDYKAGERREYEIDIARCVERLKQLR